MNLSDLANLIAKERGLQEDLVFVEYLKGQILTLNSTIIKQQFDKNGILFPQLIQTINCVSVIKVKSNTCGLGIDNEFVIRTKNKVPKPISLKKNAPFISVFNNVISKNRTTIPYLSPEELEFVKYRSFTSKSVYHTYEDDYIYVINALEKGYNLTDVGVSNIWDNPLEAKNFARQEKQNGCNCNCEDCDNEESNCFDDNDDYVLDNVVEGMILSSLYSRTNDKNN